MGRMRSALRAYALESPDTAVVLRKLDQKMQYFEGDVMATVSYAVLDPGSGKLRISSAGHFPPVVAAPGRRGALAEIAVDAPIGVADAPRRRVTTLAPAPGAVLCFFTDGLVERRNKALDDGITLLCQNRVTRAAGECLPVGDESPGRKRAPRRRHRPSRPALATRSAVVIWSAWSAHANGRGPAIGRLGTSPCADHMQKALSLFEKGPLALGVTDRTRVTCGYGCSGEGGSRVKRADLPAFWVVWGSSGSGRGRGGCGAVPGCRG